MPEERRRAPRFAAPAGIDASVGGVPVLVLDLSAMGARIEHEERLSLAAPQLRIMWEGSTVTLPARIVRSEIAGKRGSHLIYRSGLQFLTSDPAAEAVVASILQHAQPPAPAQPETTTSFEDSWIRQVNFLRIDVDDDLPYAQFRLTAAGWQKAYVASPMQPVDGFTIPRGERESAEIQRTYEMADPETRRMIQIALEAKLPKA